MSSRADIPLSVWPVAQLPATGQRRGRYLPQSSAHPGKMLPALARTAIERYSDPGDLVVDPMCGIGTTLVEAIHLGRRAVGVELEPRWARLAAANVANAERQGAPARAFVRCGDARFLAKGPLRNLVGRARLIVTSPPYGSSTHGIVSVREPFLAALVEVIAGCAAVLASDGHLVITARAYRRAGTFVDLPGQLVAIARRSGLALEARHAALICGLREDRLVPRASFFQLRWQRTGRIPRMLLIAHEDVLVFGRSAAAGGKAAASRQTA
jgi:SAM-dependent methyltransferase